MTRLTHQGARHGTVVHGDASDGVFHLLHLWVLPSRWVIILWRSPSIPSILWMASRCEWISPSRMVVPPGTLGWWSFGCKERGAKPTLGVGQVGWLGLTGQGPSRPGLVAPSLSWVLMHLCTLPPPLAPFWRCHPCVQDGGSSCMKSGLLRFNPRGCYFVTLWFLPPLEVISSSSWTQTRLRNCSFELLVNPSFMSMFSYINTILPNACTNMNLLYD
jgi:hypothetical protein